MLHVIIGNLSLLILLASELSISICDMHIELQQAKRQSAHEGYSEYLGLHSHGGKHNNPLQTETVWQVQIVGQTSQDELGWLIAELVIVSTQSAELVIVSTQSAILPL